AACAVTPSPPPPPHRAPPRPAPPLSPSTTLFRSGVSPGACSGTQRERCNGVVGCVSRHRIISRGRYLSGPTQCRQHLLAGLVDRSEEHTSELQSRFDIVCRLLLDKKNAPDTRHTT